MTRLIQPIFFMLALAIAGCANLDNPKDPFAPNSDNSTQLIHTEQSTFSGPLAAIMFGPFAALQVIHDLAQGY